MNEFKKSRYVQRSINWLNFLIAGEYTFTSYYYFSFCFLKSKPFTYEDCYNYIIDNFQFQAKEWLIYRFVSGNIASMKRGYGNLFFCINDALENQNIQSGDLKNYLRSLNRFAPGQLAFDFSLPDTGDEIKRLSEFKGKVVLIDTWHRGCGACRAIHEIMENKVKPVITSKDFVIVSVFRDNSTKEEWIKCIKSGQYASERDINVQAVDKMGLGSQKSEFSKYYYPFFFHGDPNLLLVDTHGKIVHQPLDPRIDDGKDLINKIKNELLKN